MNLTDNQKLMLVIFVLAIVGVVFLEYTKEHLGIADLGDALKKTDAAIKGAISGAQQAVSTK
jgi:hypothetical protein